MRIKSHSSPRLLQQIQLAVQRRLTYKLHSLSSQIGAVRLRVEVRWITCNISLSF